VAARVHLVLHWLYWDQFEQGVRARYHLPIGELPVRGREPDNRNGQIKLPAAGPRAKITGRRLVRMLRAAALCVRLNSCKEQRIGRECYWPLGQGGAQFAC